MRRPEIRISIIAFLLLALILAIMLITQPVIAQPVFVHMIHVPQLEASRSTYRAMTVVSDQEIVKSPKIIQVRVTAYAPFDNKSGICGDGSPAVTSRGYRPSRHYAAVDPSRIAYGTRLDVPGYGEVIAGDTGGALRSYEGYAMDVYFETYEEALAWGVRYLEVEVLR